MAAGLERAVEGASAGPLPCILQGVDLRVGTACDVVQPAADDHPFAIDDHRSHHRIRTGAPAPPLRQGERLGHVEGVARYHFSSNSASTYSSGENGIRSPIPSPTPT